MCVCERKRGGGGEERVCVHVSESAFRSQERVLGFLDLEGCNLVDIEYWERSPEAAKPSLQFLEVLLTT